MILGISHSWVSEGNGREGLGLSWILKFDLVSIQFLVKKVVLLFRVGKIKSQFGEIHHC